MNTEKAVERLREVIRRKHLALTAKRSYRAWLWRSCDNLKEFFFHVPSESQTE